MTYHDQLLHRLRGQRTSPAACMEAANLIEQQAAELAELRGRTDTNAALADFVFKRLNELHVPESPMIFGRIASVFDDVLHARGWIKDRDTLLGEVAKLGAFKEYVHRRLDQAGVPIDPGGPHTEAGCRVGDRLDIVLSFPEKLGAALGEFVFSDEYDVSMQHNPANGEFAFKVEPKETFKDMWAKHFGIPKAILFGEDVTAAFRYPTQGTEPDARGAPMTDATILRLLRDDDEGLSQVQAREIADRFEDLSNFWADKHAPADSLPWATAPKAEPAAFPHANYLLLLIAMVLACDGEIVVAPSDINSAPGYNLVTSSDPRSGMLIYTTTPNQ